MSKLKAKFTNYMKIALKNDAIDYFRAFKRANKYKNVSYDNSLENVLVSEIDASTFFDNKYSLNDIKNNKLDKAIRSLSKRQFEILSLYINGLSASEISNELNMAVGTVYASISQIKKKIKKYMEE